MYHQLIRRVTLRSFQQVNEHRYEDLLSGCSPTIRHRFGGDHALGGERHDVEALRAWFARLERLLPSLELHVHDVWVHGWPWRTTAVARWTSTGVYPDGSRYDNHGVHVVELRWGRALSIDANEDSQAVDRLLRALAAAGQEEAAAPPITSAPPAGQGTRRSAR